MCIIDSYYPNGVEKKCNSYTALKKSNLKEMRIAVSYTHLDVYKRQATSSVTGCSPANWPRCWNSRLRTSSIRAGG